MITEKNFYLYFPVRISLILTDSTYNQRWEIGPFGALCVCDYSLDYPIINIIKSWSLALQKRPVSNFVVNSFLFTKMTDVWLCPLSDTQIVAAILG